MKTRNSGAVQPRRRCTLAACDRPRQISGTRVRRRLRASASRRCWIAAPKCRPVARSHDRLRTRPRAATPRSRGLGDAGFRARPARRVDAGVRHPLLRARPTASCIHAVVDHVQQREQDGRDDARPARLPATIHGLPSRTSVGVTTTGACPRDVAPFTSTSPKAFGVFGATRSRPSVVQNDAAGHRDARTKNRLTIL